MQSSTIRSALINIYFVRAAVPNYLLLLCLLLAIVAPPTVDGTKLVQLQLVFRHGIRNPLHLVPNDPYADRYKSSLGRLTPAGFDEMRELGQFVRNHYKEQGLLPDRYDPNQVVAHSTDTSRTVDSRLAFLSGLFPSFASQSNSSSTNKQFTLLKPVPKSQDVFKPTSYTCPARDRLLNAAMNGPAYRAETIRARDFLKRLAEATGKADFSLKDAWNLGSSAQMWLGMRLPLPSWLSNSDYESLQFLRRKEYQMKFDYNPAIRRFCGGPILDRMLSSARAKLLNDNNEASKNGSSIRLIIYSAHDSTVAALASALGVGQAQLGFVPPPAALLAMEVYSDSSLRFVYRNSTKRSPRRLLPPGCGKNTDCTLDRMTPKYFPSLDAANLAYECSAGRFGLQLFNSVHPAFGAPMVLLLIMSVCVFILCSILVFGKRLCRGRVKSTGSAASQSTNGSSQRRDYAYKPLIDSADQDDDELDENARL